MVNCEATIAFPLIASAAYHGKVWEGRKGWKFNAMLDEMVERQVAGV